MKKKLIWLVIILFSVSFINACSDDDDNPTENNDGGGSAVTSISGTLTDWALGDGYTIKLVAESDGKATFEAGSSAISTSGSFNIENLKDVPADYLYPASDDLPEGITSTNPNANITDAYFYLYNSSGAYAGEAFYEGVITSTQYMGVFYVYVDADVEFSGTSTTTEWGGIPVTTTVDITFKKGWNKYYMVSSYSDTSTTITMTTTSVEGGEWSYSYGKKAPVENPLFK